MKAASRKVSRRKREGGSKVGRAMRVRVLFCDVDGVFTDGGIILGEKEDLRRFHAQDGIGVVLARQAGLPIVLLSRRKSGAVLRRAKELQIEAHVGILDKVRVMNRCLARLRMPREEAAFLGDDVQDLVCLETVGFPMATRNAVPEVKAVSRMVTRRAGGDGAVREAVEFLLRREGRWTKTLREFLAKERGEREVVKRESR